MLAPDGMLQGHYRITYTVEERPDSLLYRAIDQRESLRVLVAALPQPSQAALEDVQSLARQIETVQVPGLLAHPHPMGISNGETPKHRLEAVEADVGPAWRAELRSQV